MSNIKKELEKFNEKQKIVKLDFTGCKTAWEYHERIRVAFDFPEWYGKNWSAFWDLLRTECDADKVEITGEHTLSRQFQSYIEKTHEILQRNKDEHEEYGYIFEYEVID